MSIFAVKDINRIGHGLKELTQEVDYNLVDDRKVLATDLQHNHDYTTLSDIYSKLIELTGRYCEHFASDLLYDLQDVASFTEPCEISKPNRWVLGFGFRECGVDGNSFLEHRLKDSYDYRRIVALNIEDREDDLLGWVREYKLVQID